MRTDGERIPVFTTTEGGITIVFGYPPDNARSYGQPRGSKVARSIGGIPNTWSYGDDYFLAFTGRWIDRSDADRIGPATVQAVDDAGAPVGPVRGVTTWWQAGAGPDAGWQGAINLLRDGVSFTWYNSLEDLAAENGQLCYLVTAEGREMEDDLTTSVAMVIRSTTPFTGY